MVRLNLQNLDRLQKIVDASGVPTQYFIRFIQSRGGAVTDIDALLQELEAIIDAIKDNEIIAGLALAGGGKLADGDVTIDHAESGVTPDTYGDALNIPQITVDEFGHVTAAGEIPLSVAAGVELEEGGAPVAGGPFGTLNFSSGATVMDAGGGVATVAISGGGGGADHIPVVDGSFPPVFIQNLDGSLVLTLFV